MARGGARPGSGPAKGVKYGKRNETTPEAIALSASKLGMTPLDYMLSVMNDPKADDVRRDRMAQAAAPFVHAKPGDALKGKKEQQQEAAEEIAASGKFAPRRAPKLVVNNSK